MSEVRPPPPWGRPVSPGHLRSGVSYGAAAGGGPQAHKGRHWHEIVQEARDKRNILELLISKIRPEQEKNDEVSKAKSKIPDLTHDDLSDFLFKTLQIKRSDVMGLDYSGSGYGHREVEVNPQVELTPYLRAEAISYRDHKIIVKKQEKKTTTKVIFRNVPLSVPDEEILSMCPIYGELVGGVTRERVNNTNDRGMFSNNRSIEINLNAGVSFENYYWMEGPLPSDQGRRVIVTHQNQPMQCGHCFGYDHPKYQGGRRCPAKGKGAACKESGTKRTTMGGYMQELKDTIGYVSLKVQNTSKSFTAIRDDEATEENGEGVNYKTPIQEKNEEIVIMKIEQEKIKEEMKTVKETNEKENEKLKLETEAKAKKLMDENEKIKTEINDEKKKTQDMKEMLNKAKKEIYVKNGKEKRLMQAMKIAEDAVLIDIKDKELNVKPQTGFLLQLALAQGKEEYIINNEENTLSPKEGGSLERMTKSVEESIKSDNEITKEEAENIRKKMDDVKNWLLEKLTEVWKPSERRFSLSKRPHEDDQEDEHQHRRKSVSHHP